VSPNKLLPQFMVDVAMILLAYAFAFFLRFDFNIPQSYGSLFLQGLVVVAITKPLVFVVMGFYKRLWRYASLRDAVAIFKVVTITSVCTWSALTFFSSGDLFPRSIIIMDWLILLFLAAASRLARRLRSEHKNSVFEQSGRRTLIVGAGEAGRLLLTEIGRQPEPHYNVVGLVDDDKRKQGMFLDQVRVLGTQVDLPELVRRYRIEDLLIAVPSARGVTLRKIIENCRRTGARVRILPAISEIIEDKVSVSQVRDVVLEDLLGRAPVTLNKTGISEYLQGKVVLVSGAAGSIGSEICRQIAMFDPQKIILLDSAETPLFYMERELAEKYPDLDIVPVLGDVRICDKIDAVFSTYKPEVVFHAAAYKHVSMIECNPTEAVSNNIRGTMVLADASHRSGVASFVMISTDKAVKPTNVMGASKRVAEIYVQNLARESKTKFSTVRFGNVLGSNGSVVPLFIDQIKKGGPVTVTDPNVYRYFMTIPEAAQLVLQAGCIGCGGEVFLLEMGEPVRILDLAEDLIRLSGLSPHKDIDIVFTGLRPGEKLSEELLTEGEGIKETGHEKIRVAAPVAVDPNHVRMELNQLLRLADYQDTTGIVQALQRLVVEFTPSSRHQYPLSQEMPNAETASTSGGNAQTVRSGRILPFRHSMLKRNPLIEGS